MRLRPGGTWQMAAKAQFEEHYVMLRTLTAHMELLLRHDGIAPTTAPTIVGRHNDLQGRRTAYILVTSGVHDDDRGDVESYFEEEFHYEASWDVVAMVGFQGSIIRWNPKERLGI